MKSWKKPTNELVDRTFGLMRKEFDHEYFFSRLKNPLWIQPLVERGCFQFPPKMKKLPGGYIQTPVWPELRYLKNVAKDAPDEVLEVVRALPEVDNPRVYDDILDITLQLDAKRSAKLLSKILESTELERPIWGHKYANVLVHWTEGNETSAALELTKALVEFVPDPESKNKQARRRKKPLDPATIYDTKLEPLPRIDSSPVDSSEYNEILTKGVRSLAKMVPYKVACILINTTANMIRFRTHQSDLAEHKDYSEVWCERLTESESNLGDPETILVHTLVHACERVYEKKSEAVPKLDSFLRNQEWGIFKRLRHHLLALHPNNITKPWIQELIRKYEGYHRREYDYEFQQMIQSAYQKFGASLLTEAERKQIFDAICSGPSKASYRAWIVDFLEDEFTEEKFKDRQRRFHRAQLRPFACILFGKYADYFKELEYEAENPISDEDYSPYKTQTSLGPNNQSPITPKDLAICNDEELLEYINHWNNEEVFYDGRKYMEINNQGLAQAFKTVFKKSIITDANRLRFWMENFENIERPFFLERMLAVMRERIEARNFNKLNEWLVFCHRVLIHTDYKVEDAKKRADGSSEVPEWYSPRWTVGDFIRVCLDKDTDIPVSAREQLRNLLDTLCTQFDWHLDREATPDGNQTNLADKGINNPRGKALRDLINFGFWIRKRKLGSESWEVTRVLEKRFSKDSQYPLTLPEYAILGMSYNHIFSLDNKWAIKNKPNLFPQNATFQWLAAFGSHLQYNRACIPTFEVLRDEYSFALQLLDDFNKQHGPDDERASIFDRHRRESRPEEKLMRILGRHLFIYYLWEMFPLKGESSLLQRYYQVTDANRERWGHLFEYVGRTLRDTSEQLEQDLIDRIIDFFDWRLQVNEPVELKQFNFWLKANCLTVQWRLDACAKVLEICKSNRVSIIIPLDALREMLPDCPAKVVACFARLTDDIGDDNIYIYTDEAKTILSAGLGSSDQDVRQNAERARENLLRIGRFDLMELGDSQS